MPDWQQVVIGPQAMSEKYSENSVFRILDAAVNRAAEGLRVVEDYLRMDIGDAHLAKTLKQLRHDLTTATATIDPEKRIAARDSVGDVGRTIETANEYERGTSLDTSKAAAPAAQALVQPNLARAQQALRTIEEFSKTIDVELAKKIEQLRYRVYTAEKAILTTMVSLKNLSAARLYVLVDAQREPNDDSFDGLATLTKQLLDAGVDVIQLRDKMLTDRQLVRAGRRMATICRGTQMRFIMNDRVDLAIACNADGVHLGQDELTVSDARKMMGAARIIGVSTHSLEQARQAVLDGANYIGVGPVFPSQTKEFASHVGLDLVQSVAEEITLPTFAIGGINLDNVDSVCAAGQSRVAVSHAIVGSPNPMESAKLLIEKLTAN